MRRFILVAVTTVSLSVLATAAGAAVYAPQQQLPATTIQNFKSNPDQLLGNYPAGGAGMISRVRDLVASDPSTLSSVIDLLKKQDQKLKEDRAKLETATGTEARDLSQQVANLQAQIRGIASGLAQVARLASRTDQAFASEIQTAVAGSGSEFAVAAYQASTGDTAIAAGGGGGAGGGGTGGGGPTGTGGFVFGGNNGGASSFNGLHYSTMTTGSGSGSVGGTTSSSSVSRR